MSVCLKLTLPEMTTHSFGPQVWMFPIFLSCYTKVHLIQSSKKLSWLCQCSLCYVLCWWLVHQSMRVEGHSKEPVCDVTGRFRIRDSDTGTGTGTFLRPRACKLWLKRKYSFFSLSICNVLINLLYMSMSPGNLNLIIKDNVLFSNISKLKMDCRTHPWTLK